MDSDVFDDPRLTAAGLFFEAHAGLSAKLAPTLERSGLSSLDFDALTRLSRSPGRQLRMTDLAAQLSLSTSGVTRAVDRLQRGGLVRRASSPDDRRSTYAVLTPEGAERLHGVLGEHLDGIERWFTGLFTPEQLADLVTNLRTLRDAVHPNAAKHTAPPPAGAQ
ncbi:HTH-type transcriptional regulator MhqR [Streptomyces sp. YIM 121038]|uniref:MarR family winged helix-turn-helix transcriptional regulator n=1 Tax=Streptomyces sp. YIM 121038 TaxID=2136401 RepID=UPI001110CCFE|nr:MarR family transcriptional regulator [Streptomyces sp. YIM 121038]QCX81443.1 HTH-type transcriptional regulator MhqR [Streptomyces sp. YIM 121038]